MMRYAILFSVAMSWSCKNKDVETTGPEESSSTTTTSIGTVTGTQVGEQLLTLTLTEPAGVTRDSLYLRSGVPLPQGLVDADTPVGLSIAGELVPTQTQVLSVWADGSVRWMLFEATVRLEANEVVSVDVVELANPLEVPDALQLTDGANEIIVDTGPLRIEIPKNDGGVLGQIWVNDAPMLAEGAVGPYIRTGGSHFEGANLTSSASPAAGDAVADADPDRTLVAPWPLSVTIEEQGPIHAVIRVSGSHIGDDGMGFSTFITRLHLSRGKAEVRVEHTVVYTGEEDETIDSYGFKVPLVGTTPWVDREAGSQVHQFAADQYTLGGGDLSGSAIGTLAQNHGANFSIVSLRDMAETFPKALVSDANGVDVQLFPAEDGPWNLARYSHSIDTANGESGSITNNRGAQGLARTDSFVLQFGNGAHPQGDAADHGEALNTGPVLAVADPSWVSDAKVMGVGDFVFPTDNASPAHYRTDRYLTVVSDFMRVNQRSEYLWYGLENYGDIRGLFDGGNASFTWHELGRYGWSGNSGEPANQLWMQYLRSPSQAVLRDAEALTRHTQDVQMIHYGDADRVDESPWNGRNRSSAVGSLHRHGRQAFSGYGGLPEYSHVAGLETWYYLSGDLRAKDALFEAAMFIEQYSESNPDHTALVNGIDVLSRAEAVFWDTPHAAVFAARNEVLLDFVDNTDAVNELLDETNALPFGLFVRGTPGLAYHHERTGDSRAFNGVIAAADRLVAPGDPYELTEDGQNGGEFFHMLPLAYAAGAASDPGPYQELAAQILALNCHVEDGSDADAISDASLQAIPSDWRDWQFAWQQDPLSASGPGILWIDRQITYRNDFLQDYHSYRLLTHLATIAAVVPANGDSCVAF